MALLEYSYDFENDTSSDEEPFGIVEEPKKEFKEDDEIFDECQYEVLGPSELLKLQREIIDDISSILELPGFTTRMLLNHFKWDKEKLIQKYFDGNRKEIFRLANISNVGVKKLPPNGHPNDPGDCQICLSERLPTELTGMTQCGHVFCIDCWRGFLTSNIMTDTVAPAIPCASFRCPVFVDDNFVTRWVEDAKVLSKYEELVIKDGVTYHQSLRWCPAAGCTYAICIEGKFANQVRCKCGHAFCFTCGEDGHKPVPCKWLKLWQNYDESDDSSCMWIARNTKDCPRCSAPIEKNGGCNHMTCRKCRYEFCWLCNNTWAGHSACNRYVENTSNKFTNAQMRLDRYKHFRSRFTNHSNSLELEKCLLKKLHDLPQRKFEFLKEGAIVLRQCRELLKYSYAFAFYLMKNNQTMIFEDNQADLEVATELLAEFLERELSDKNFFDIKSRIVDKTQYCEQRRVILLDHIREGFEKDWWKIPN